MEDLISRQAAIDALGERPMVWMDNDNYSLGQRNQYDSDRLAIETVPSAQPERKTGRWIDMNGDGRLYECDQCHDISCCKGKFCMECGAKMEVEHE